MDPSIRRSSSRSPVLKASSRVGGWGLLVAASLLVFGVGLQEARAQTVAPADARFVASSEGTVFYPVDCDAWRSLSVGNLRFFQSEGMAIAAGYRATTSRTCLEPANPDRLLRTRTPGKQQGPGRVVGICLVESIVDGDTLDCHGGVRVRLLLIDAPEVAGDGYSLRASLALEELLAIGDSAVVTLDVEELDRYGRLLAHLYDRDGVWINLEMVRRGYAVPLVYPPNVLGVEHVRAAAEAAREGRVGLWSVNAFACLPVDRRAGACGGSS